VEPSTSGLIPLAVALFASLALGRLASRFGVPRVTVYLLVGLALGPHGALRWLDAGGSAAQFLLGPAAQGPLRALTPVALGFILFQIGAHFRLEVFRREGPRVLTVSAAEIGLTALLVAAAVYGGTGDWRLATVAPALAMATAPSATLVTLREIEAEGPASRCLVLCVGQNNIAALLAFPLLVSLAFGVGHPLAAVGFVLAALVGGAVIGLVGAVWLESISGRRELVLFGLLVVLATLGLGHGIRTGGTELGMLGCFAAGMALANGSPHAEPLFRYLENTVYPLYVLFFIAAGRGLHVEALAGAGALGVLFVAARGAGKWAGTRAGLELAGWGERLPRDLGAGLMCQAGVALGLATALAEAVPDPTAQLRHVVVASVVVFELVGPWLVRRTAVRAGEVKLANLYSHPEATGPDALRWVGIEIRRNLGLLRAGGEPRTDGPTVRHAMRRRPTTVPETLPFERVLKLLGEAGAELLPVVNAEGRLRGIISYDEVKNALYDPALRGLVIAGDLTSPVDDPLEPETPLSAALERMDLHRVQSWPVTEGDRLLGLVRRSDLYALLRRGRR
jgi:Kef-type K+ transport system membrane component KefB/CBS domain-containing protein